MKKKIAFICQKGLDTFIEPIVREIEKDANYQVHRYYCQTQQEVIAGVKWADIVFCEWCNEITIIASQVYDMKKKGVIIRLHSYESLTNMPSQIDWSMVDYLIFVAPHIREIVKRQIPDIRKRVCTKVIYNGLDIDKIPANKELNEYNIAYVCYLNYRKAPDLALQIMARLVEGDKHNDHMSDGMVNCKCGGKGFLTTDYYNLDCCVCYDRDCNRTSKSSKTRGGAVSNWNDENIKYNSPESAQQVINKFNGFKLHVAGAWQDERYKIYMTYLAKEMGIEDDMIYYGFIKDMSDFWENKGIILSTSIHEGHPLNIMEGMARGLKPVIHNFYGAHNLYKDEWLFNTINEAVEMIYSAQKNDYRQYVIDKGWTLDNQVKQIKQLIGRLANKRGK